MIFTPWVVRKWMWVVGGRLWMVGDGQLVVDVADSGKWTVNGKW